MDSLSYRGRKSVHGLRVPAFLAAFLCSTFSPAQQDSAASSLQSRVLSVVSKVENENRFTGNMNPDSAAALPFGILREIGGTRYVIAIDSATFRPGAAAFSAFMALEFPGATQKICFAAQHIACNPKGVLPGPASRLLLVSEHRISLGPKVTMVLKPDGFNYVEWDCNGFAAVNLKGYFEFDPGMIYPDPAFSSDSLVRASFQVHTGDIHDFIVQTTMAPFCVRGLKDVSFSVLDATADFSETANAQNMIFPAGYDLGNCNGDPLLWNGFYMRQFRVRLPKELSKSGQRAEILANNLLIDNSGVSGWFGASHLFTCAQGSMNGWGFSIVNFGVSVVSNHVNGGSMSGFVKLPVSETDSVAYSACVSENTQTHEMDYSFSVSPAADFHAQVLSATLTLYNTSTLTITRQNGKFLPIAVLNGKAAFSSAHAQAGSLNFQQLTLASEAPVLRAGIFALTSSDSSQNRMAGFSYSINAVTVGVLNNVPAIKFQVGVNFMDGNANQPAGISAAAGFTVITKTMTVTDPAGEQNATKIRWEFDRVQINQVLVDYGSNAFQLHGVIDFRENDPVYGNGFSGQLALSIDHVLPAPATSDVWFGKMNGYRYFFVDAAVPFTIPLSGCSVYRFMGGVYDHMHRAGNVSPETELYSPAFGNAATYVPDQQTSLGIKAGVTLGTSGDPKPCNGDLALEMTFNASGGIDQLHFAGNVYFMTGIAQRQHKAPAQLPAIASLVMQYDFVNNAFHAVMGAQVHLPGVAANGTAILHFDAQNWYLYIGRPQQRMNVTIAGLATFSSYFEAGTSIDPMPPPPPSVTQVVNANGLNDQRNETALSNGSGFAFGAAFGSGFNGQVGFDHWYVYYSLSAGAGFDIMVLDYGPAAHCANSTDVVGINGWYAGGQVYAYLQGAAGVHGHVSGQDFDITILSVSAAAILQARVPNPSWVGGAVGCDYDVLGGLVSGHVDMNFETGQQCSVLN